MRLRFGCLAAKPRGMKRPGLMLFLLTTALLGASCRPDANTPAEMTQKLDPDAAKAYIEAGCSFLPIESLNASLKQSARSAFPSNV